MVVLVLMMMALVSPKARAKAKAGARPRNPPRTDARKINCGNCGGEHTTRDCIKPTLPLDKRHCFNCGEVGHAARDCKKSKKALLAADEGPAQVKAPRVLCMMTEDGSDQVFTLGDFQVFPGRGTSQKARRFDQAKMDIAFKNAFWIPWRL